MQTLQQHFMQLTGWAPYFIIDTGRNGAARDPRSSCQTWCNTRGAGAGHAPTMNTGLPHVVDAYWYLKTPGESDGCTRVLPSGENCARFDASCEGVDSIGGTTASGEPRAPEAGSWFVYQARMLARNAHLHLDAPGTLDPLWGADPAALAARPSRAPLPEPPIPLLRSPPPLTRSAPSPPPLASPLFAWTSSPPPPHGSSVFGVSGVANDDFAKHLVSPPQPSPPPPLDDDFVYPLVVVAKPPPAPAIGVGEHAGRDGHLALGGMAALATVCFCVSFRYYGACGTADETLPKRRASRRPKRVSKRGAVFQEVSDEQIE